MLLFLIAVSTNAPNKGRNIILANLETRFNILYSEKDVESCLVFTPASLEPYAETPIIVITI